MNANSASNRILARDEEAVPVPPIQGEISSIEFNLSNAEAALRELGQTIEPILRKNNPIGQAGNIGEDKMEPEAEIHISLSAINSRVKKLIDGINDLRQRSVV